MRVGIDLDGVLFNFSDSLKRWLVDRGHKVEEDFPPGETLRWEFYKDWGYTGAEFVTLCNQAADEEYLFCGPARPNAVQAVNEIYGAGHTVVIITDRQFGSTPKSSERNTTNWLKQHSFLYDELYFSADKTLVPTDVFVEDKLENYDALAKTPCVPYLINRPWNDIPGGDNRRRLSDISDFAAILVKNYGAYV